MTPTAPTRTLRRTLALSTALGVTLGVFATPAAAQTVQNVLPGNLTQGATVENAVTIPGQTVNVTVNAPRAVVDWSSFNVPNGTTANFVNASTAGTAVILNRVTTLAPTNTTTLAGTINAVNNLIAGNGLPAGQQGNGVEVWVANPNGIVMGATGNFNTQGFVATTRSFDATDVGNFVAGNAALTLTAPSGLGSTPNSGITGAAGQIVTDGHVLAFIAPVIRLSAGTFDAGAGDVAFVTASDVTIGNPGSPLTMTINAGTALDAASGTALQVGGAVTGGNAYFIASAQTGVDALLNVTAGVTTASSVNGVVVLAKAASLGVPFTFATGAGSDNDGSLDVTLSGALTANGGGGILVVNGTTGGGIANSGALTVTGANNVDLIADGALSISDNVTVGGAYNAVGSSVVLGRAAATVLQQAGVSNIEAKGGTISSVGDLRLSTTSTDIALGGTGTTGIDLTGSSIQVGTTGTGGLAITTNTNAASVVLGDVTAGTLGLSSARTGVVTTGDLVLNNVNPETIRTTGVLTTGAVASTDELTLRGDAGVVVGGALTKVGAGSGIVSVISNAATVSLQGSNLAGALTVDAAGDASFTDLAGAGSKSIVAGGGIAGTSIAGAGAVTLRAGLASPITITGTLGASGARIGVLTINGSNGATIGTTGATGTTAFLTSASIGQAPGVATAGLTVNGGTDHSGTFTSTTTGATTMGDVASGAAFQATAGLAGASFGALSGAGSKTVTTTGSIGATSIRGAGAVVLTGGSGAVEGVTVGGGIGASGAPVASLTVNGGNASLGNVVATGAALLGQGAGLNSLTTGSVDVGRLTSDTTTLLIAPGTNFTGAVRARTGAIDVGSANGITFAGTLDGPAALVVQAGVANSVTFGGSVGALQPFTTLTSVGVATVRLNAASVTTTGAQNYGGSLVLGADATLTGTGATFTGGVQGNNGTRDHDLALNFTGAQTIAGAGVLGVRNLATDTVTAAGTTSLSGAITTSGTQTYNDAVLLTGVGDVALVGGGNVTFNNTLGGPRGLLVTTPGTLAFGGVVGGGGNPLDAIGAGTVGAVVIKANVTTTGAQTYAPVTLNGGGDVTLTAGGSVVIGGLSGPRGLTVNSPGITAITGNNGAALAFVTTDAAGTTTLSGTINSVGEQTYAGATALTGNTVLSGTRAVFGAGLTGGGFDLTLNSSGAQQLGGGVSGIRNLLSDAAGTLAITGDITTTGTQTYNDATTLTVSATLNAGTNAITFGGTLGSLDEGQALTTTSPTVFNGDVGGAAGGGVRLLSLTTGGATTVGGAGARTIRTVGAQSYGGLLTLNTGGVLIGSGATFTAGVTGTAAHNDLTLTFTGATTLGPEPFANIGDFAVTGTGPLTLNGNLTTFDSQTYVPTLTLGANAVLTSQNAGAITFATIAGGGRALTVNTAGVTSFTAGAGGLASLATDGPGSTSVAGTIATSGAQTFGDALVIAADTDFTSSGGGAIGFGGTITGAHALSTTTAGRTTFGGAVGATLPDGTADAAVSPTSVTSAGVGLVRVDGGSIATSGAQAYVGLLQLGANTVLTGVAGSFTGGIDGNGFDLTLNFSGATTIDGGSFGGVNNFASGGGGVTNLAGAITTIGGQTYGDAVTLIGATTLASSGGGAIRFADTLDGAQALRITTAGQTRFDAAIGGITPLASLLIDGSGGILLNGGSIRTDGAQTYTGATTLGVDTLLATDGGDIGFAGTVDGAQLLSVRTSLAGAPVAGTVSFGGAVGGGTALIGLAIRANAATAVGGNRVGTLAAQVNGGGLTFANAAALTIGTVDGLSGIATGAGVATIGAGGLLTLASDVTAGGAALSGVGVTQNAGTSIVAGAGTILIDGNDGALALAGTLTTTNGGAGAVRLIDASTAQLGIITTGAGGTLTLGEAGGDALSGAVTQAVGTTIAAGTLAGNVGGTATLTEANGIATLGAFSAAGLALRTTGALTVTGPVTTGTGPLSLQLDAGALTLNGNLTGGAVTFVVAGGITQDAAGSVITATSLSGSAGGDVSLPGANRIGSIGAFSSTGGFAFNNAQTLTITSDLTVSGALQIGATDLDFTGRTLTAGGAATLSASGALTGGTVVAGGNVTGTGTTIALDSATAGTTPTGALTLTATGTLSLGSGTAGRTIALTSTNGPLTATTLTAGTAGNTAAVTSIGAVSGGTTGVGTATSNNGSVTVNGASASLTTGVATNGALNMTASGGVLTLGMGDAGATATLNATGPLSVTGGLTSGGDGSLTATGTAMVNAVESTGGALLVRGSSVTLGSDPTLMAARSASALTVEATAGDVTLTNAVAGSNASLTATGAITGTSLLATGTATVTGGGAVGLGTLAGTGVTAQGGSVAITTATATGALILKATGGDLSLGTGEAGTTVDLTATGALTVGISLTGGNTGAGGNVTTTSGGATTITAVQSRTGAVSATGGSVAVGTALANTTLLLRGTAGAVSLGTGTAGGAATLDAQGPLTVSTGVTAATATLTATGVATVQSVTTTAGTISVRAGSATVVNADARTTLDVTATAGDATLTTGRSGGDTVVQATRAVTLGTITSGGALTATASGGALSLGSGTATSTATLGAAGPLTIATALTSGGKAMTTATGATTIGAIRSTGGAVSVTGGSADVTSAQAATTLDLIATTGNLTLGTGTAGGAATLTSAGTLGTTALTATGAATLTATGAATLGQTSAGGAVAVTAATIGAGQTIAATTLTMTSAGNLTLAGGQAGGNASFDANGTAALGQVIAGTASTITIKALDAAIMGTQRAATVAFVNRAPATTAFKLGDSTSAGGFALSQIEVNNVEAGQLTVDGGAGNIEVGALAFDADAGRTRVDLLSTGRIDVIGAMAGGGAGRTFRLGGTATSTTDKAGVIRVVATASAGGRLLFDTADLDLRGTRIGIGQAAGFLDPIGLSPGGTPQSAGAVAAAYVGNPNSSLYNSTFGGALYTGSPVLVSARSLTVRYGDYALIQNTGVPGQNTGATLGSVTTPVTPALILQGPAPSANAFAIFGSINGITGTGAAVLGSSVIQVSGADIANTRVNGCLAGSGAGCLTAVVSQPLLNVFDSSRLNVFRAADDLALPFDPVVGTNNEALFSGFGLIESPVTGTECSDDQSNPNCAQNREQGK